MSDKLKPVNNAEDMEQNSKFSKFYRSRVDIYPHLGLAACKLEKWNESKRELK